MRMISIMIISFLMFFFLLFQASIFEALTQSFQVAFSLRSYSLTEAGNVVKLTRSIISSKYLCRDPYNLKLALMLCMNHDAVIIV